MIPNADNRRGDATPDAGTGRTKADGLVFDRLARGFHQPTDPLALDLTPQASPADRLRIEFTTPTEIRGSEHVVAGPEFAAVFAGARDRVGAARGRHRAVGAGSDRRFSPRAGAWIETLLQGRGGASPLRSPTRGGVD